jgi:hypothetical protein
MKLTAQPTNEMITRFNRMKAKPWALCVAPGLIGLAFAAFAADTPTNAVPATTNAASLGPEVTGRHAADSFWKRFDAAMLEALGTPAYAAPAAPPPGTPEAPQANRRGNPTPFDSPPFPDGEWQIGGTEIIGDQNLTPDNPLMQAIYDGPHGQAWRDSRIKFYGWEDFSGNYSTSRDANLNPVNAQGGNFPLAYDQRPNRIEQNQVVLYAERTPDEYQTGHVDWGFRLSAVYGLDYRYMISRGWDDAQLVKRNNFYGYDSPMMYANLYVPWVAQGLNLTLGRIISEADIEAQLAPNNLMSSHSLLYTFDPYCQWGLFGTLKLNKNWTVQAGISAGNDVTPWETQDPGCQPTAAVMVQYQSDNNKFSFYGGGNCMNNAQWGFNNIQQYVGTLTYKLTDTIWTSHESWYMYQEHCPGQPTVGNPAGYRAPDEPLSQNGGFGYNDAETPVHPGYACEWATLNYTMFRLRGNLFFTVRNELFNDTDGNRTGYATLYSEHSIGFTWWPCRLITVRPELRYDRTYGTHGSSGASAAVIPGTSTIIDEAKPFDDGTRRQQVTAQFDVVFYF